MKHIMDLYGGGRMWVGAGSFSEEAIHAALERGYREVISVGVHAEGYRQCARTFSRSKRVRLLWGDPSTVVPRLLLPSRTRWDAWLGSGVRSPLGIIRSLRSAHRRDGQIILDGSILRSHAEDPWVMNGGLEKALWDVNPQYCITRLGRGASGMGSSVVAAWLSGR